MSKKKKQIDKRLDKLFDDLKQEETDQTLNLATSSVKPASPSRSQKAKKSVPNTDELETILQERQVLESTTPAFQPSSTLSTAFRTDQNSWATLKVVDETEHRVWGLEDQMLIRQVGSKRRSAVRLK